MLTQELSSGLTFRLTWLPEMSPNRTQRISETIRYSPYTVLLPETPQARRITTVSLLEQALSHTLCSPFSAAAPEAPLLAPPLSSPTPPQPRYSDSLIAGRDTSPAT